MKCSLGICFLLEDFFPIMHGTTTQILLLSQYLKRYNTKITVVTRKITREQKSVKYINGIKTIRVRPSVGLNRLGKYLMYLPAMLALIKIRKDYDVIIVCDLKALGLIGIAAGKLLRKKCILRAESLGEFDGSYAFQFGKPASCIKKNILQLFFQSRNKILKYADAFISICRPIYNEFIEGGVSRKKIYNIYNGIDLREYIPLETKEKNEIRKKLRFNNSKYFVYTGRLTKGKGLRFLLRVWQHLLLETKNIHLLIIGTGGGYTLTLEDELKEFVMKNNINDSVTFTGRVENVVEFLNASDFFILPSQTEALSLSLIEAMACGLPCIATACGGNTEIITHRYNGILVNFGDDDQLIDALYSLMNDHGLCTDLAKNAAETVKKRFDIQKISDQYIRLCSTLTLV